MVRVEQQADDLRLLIPADTEHLRAARLVAADAGGRAGFDCEETEDLRIAIDELCHCLMRVSNGPISLSFAVSASGVVIEGRARAASAVSQPMLHPISEAILRSSTDYFEIEADPPDVRFSFGKAGVRTWG